MPEQSHDGPAKSRYMKLAMDQRQQFLQRAQHNALLTIPSLMPLEGRSSEAHLHESFQGMGSAGVVHLSSRLTMALLPAGRPYMRLDLPPKLLFENGGTVDKDIERGLALAEQLIQQEVEDKGWRPSTLMSVQQQLVTGNVCEHQLPDNTIRVFRLDQYVVTRNYAGVVREAILFECLTYDTAPEAVRAVIGSDHKADEKIELYTVINLQDNGLYRIHQEVGSGEKVGEPSERKPEDLEYLFLRWSWTPGEDYGRSKIEEHIADLRSLDGLEKSMLEMAAMASRNFITVRPGSTGAAVKRQLTQAVNGDILMMDPEGVELKSFDNVGGFQITSSQVNTLRESLARAFLLLGAGQRDAERVTAAEIERDIQELEAALGGNFSTLNTDMMERRTRLLMKNMEARGALPQGVVSETRPTVLTGLEALSRERDVGRAVQLIQIAAGAGEAGLGVLNMQRLISRVGIGLGFPDAVNTDAEIAAKAQAQQEQQMAAMVAEKGLDAAAKNGGPQE